MNDVFAVFRIFLAEFVAFIVFNIPRRLAQYELRRIYYPAVWVRASGLILLVICVSFGRIDILQAASAPQLLLGHSVSVGWVEERVQRTLPDDNWRSVQIQRRSDVYISTAGRIFRRESAMTNFNRGPLVGSTDHEVSAGNAQFQGSTLIITAPALRGSAARQVTVQFEPGFGGCHATVINGRSAGEGSYVIRSLTNNREIEIKSVQSSLVTCKIVDGNVLQ